MRGRRLVAAGALFWAWCPVACTSGTTPDCSDAQCGAVVSLGDGGDAARTDGSLDSSPDAVSDGPVDGGAHQEAASEDGGVAGGG